MTNIILCFCQKFDIAIVKHTIKKMGIHVVEKIIWNINSYSSIEEIDIHTKKIISITNQIVDAINNDSCTEKISSFMFSLIYFAHNNIKQKEDYLKKVDYPNLSTQKAHNKVFINKIIDFKNKISDNKPDICIEIYYFLCDWIEKCRENNLAQK